MVWFLLHVYILTFSLLMDNTSIVNEPKQVSLYHTYSLKPIRGMSLESGIPPKLRNYILIYSLKTPYGHCHLLPVSLSSAMQFKRKLIVWV